MTRHRASARSSNEEGGRSNAPRWRWLKAGCLSSFHLCLLPPRLSRTSFCPKRGLEAASSPNASMHISPKTPQRELSSLFPTHFLDVDFGKLSDGELSNEEAPETNFIALNDVVVVYQSLAATLTHPATTYVYIIKYELLSTI
ncbi:hypothetical protein ALC60_05599 [Trachymyrmex zeteki]|uniref:Uncharacterized protein n=1 Tax=Mycetomoellerius zeteki TaxID=64791 RepID=A0A151X576_9HYME|nr:hypothetical protein ALC60_05599 [Trachymyrmex zeteki]